MATRSVKLNDLEERVEIVNADIKEIDKALKGKTKKRGDSFTIFTIGRVSVQKNPSLFNKIASKFPNINLSVKWLILMSRSRSCSTRA